MLEAYLKLSISTFLSFHKLSHVEDKSDYINAFLTVFLSILVLGFPPFTYFFLHKYKAKLTDEDFKGRFESLYLNVNTSVDQSILMITLFVARRLIFAISIVFIKQSSITQIAVLIGSCLVMLSFFIKIKPMN